MVAQERFSGYEQMWALEEPMKKPHKRLADELGLIDEDDLPVAPTLKIIRKSSDITEEMAEEELVAWGETQKQVIIREIEPLLAIPSVESHFRDLRQMEDGIDVSAFNTEDFLKDKPEFDKKKFAYDKIAERAEDLALLHSCINSREGREHIRHKFLALINSSYRNRGLYLVNVKYPMADEMQRAVIRQKVAEINRQIIRLKSIWQKFAHS